MGQSEEQMCHHVKRKKKKNCVLCRERTYSVNHTHLKTFFQVHNVLKKKLLLPHFCQPQDREHFLFVLAKWRPFTIVHEAKMT